MKKFTIKTRINEIDFELGLRLEEIKREYNPMTLEGKRWFLAELMNCDYDELIEVLDEQIDILYDNHIFNNSENLVLQIPDYIKIQKVLFKFKDFENQDFKISVKEFSDIDNLVSDKDLQGLIKALFEPCKYRIFNLKMLLRKSVLKNNRSWNINYYKAITYINRYSQYKQNLFNEYNLNIVDKRIPEEHQQDKVVLTPAERFGIYNVLMEICDSDMQKVLWWFNQDIKMLLKYLAYQKVRIKNS